jgi:transposase-like protein
MPKNRRHFTPEQKAAILREHLIDHVAVSDLCDKHQIQPTVFYRWQKDLFENLPSLFERKSGDPSAPLRRENETLRARLANRDEVIAEIMRDFVDAKKKLGDL